MSYLALARKWRPKTFADVVGQEHIVRALSNALETERVHHAYLFSGTRGVGKTTVARILAKALNCEKGVRGEPCGECSSCISIDEGRFVDLLEVDAASRTKVEDTRELLENVQYTPTAGRYKVYLIDEVHMLSKHSFNALLKTLEEPPPHVKFLLATTNPEALPVTILSRCLQFNLKRLSTSQIVGRMTEIAGAENFAADAQSLGRIGRAANGSMRDALSLLDQALAFGDGVLNDAEVADMLGSLDHKHIAELMSALIAGDAVSLMGQVRELQTIAPDYASVLDELATVLQQVAVVQLAGAGSLDEDADADLLEQWAQQLSPESVQLFYEIAIHGRRDLGLAPDPQVGFEMALLRMVAFQPASVAGAAPPGGASVPAENAATPRATAGSGSQAAAPRPGKGPAAQAESWPEIIAALELRGATRQLAESCCIVANEGGVMTLQMPQSARYLLTEQQKKNLTRSLLKGLDLRAVEIEVVEDKLDTIAERSMEDSEHQMRAAQESISNDPNVRELMDKFGASIEADSIKPFDAGEGRRDNQARDSS